MPPINRGWLAATIEGFGCWWLLAWHGHETSCLKEPRGEALLEAVCWGQRAVLAPLGTPLSDTGKHRQDIAYPDPQKGTSQPEQYLAVKKRAVSLPKKKKKEQKRNDTGQCSAARSAEARCHKAPQNYLACCCSVCVCACLPVCLGVCLSACARARARVRAGLSPAAAPRAPPRGTARSSPGRPAEMSRAGVCLPYF